MQKLKLKRKAQGAKQVNGFFINVFYLVCISMHEFNWKCLYILFMLQENSYAVHKENQSLKHKY